MPELPSGSRRSTRCFIDICPNLARVLVPLACWIATGVLAADRTGDWPQLQHDARRTGYNPAGPLPPYKVAWTVTIDDYFADCAQPVVADGRMVIGSKRGTFYCLNAETGSTQWTAKIGAPFVHSAAVKEGRVFAASQNGHVYCWDAQTGKKLWEIETGHSFYTAPVLVEDRVLLGNTGGTFFAVAQGDGHILWKSDVGAPIIQSAASDGKRVFFGDERIVFHALDVATGKKAWQKQCYGETFYESHPVVVGNKVMTTVTPLVSAYPASQGVRLLDQVFAKHAFHPEKPGFAEDLRNVQDEASAVLKKYPHLKSFYVMNTETGEEPYVVAITQNGSNTSVQSPPVICGKDDSVYLTWCPFCSFTQMAPIALVRFDLSLGRIVETYINFGPVDPQAGGGKHAFTCDAATGELRQKVGNFVGDESRTQTAVPGWILSRHFSPECFEIGPQRRYFRYDQVEAGGPEWDFWLVPAGKYVYCLAGFPTGSYLCALTSAAVAETPTGNKK